MKNYDTKSTSESYLASHQSKRKKKKKKDVEPAVLPSGKAKITDLTTEEKKKIASMMLTIHKLVGDNHKLKGENQSILKKLHDMTTELENETEQNKELKLRVKEYTEEYSTTQSKLKKQDSLLNALRKDLTDYQQKFQESEQKRLSTDQDSFKITEDNNKLKSESANLKNLVKTLREEQKDKNELFKQTQMALEEENAKLREQLDTQQAEFEERLQLMQSSIQKPVMKHDSTLHFSSSPPPKKQHQLAPYASQTSTIGNSLLPPSSSWGSQPTLNNSILNPQQHAPPQHQQQHAPPQQHSSPQHFSQSNHELFSIMDQLGTSQQQHETTQESLQYPPSESTQQDALNSSTHSTNYSVFSSQSHIIPVQENDLLDLIEP